MPKHQFFGETTQIHEKMIWFSYWFHWSDFDMYAVISIPFSHDIAIPKTSHETPHRPFVSPPHHEVELATLKVVKQLDPRKFVAGSEHAWSWRAGEPSSIQWWIYQSNSHPLRWKSKSPSNQIGDWLFHERGWLPNGVIKHSSRKWTIEISDRPS